jgi:hypothetical protein
LSLCGQQAQWIMSLPLEGIGEELELGACPAGAIAAASCASPKSRRTAYRRQAIPLLLRLRLLLLRLGRIVVIIIVVIRLKDALAICTEQQNKGDRQDQLS